MGLRRCPGGGGFTFARENARRAQCQSQVKQIYLGLFLYDEELGRLPQWQNVSSQRWHEYQVTGDYMSYDAPSQLGIDHLGCPSLNDGNVTYGVNYFNVISFDFWNPPLSDSRKLERVPMTTFLLADSITSTINSPTYSTWALDEDYDGDGLNDSADMISMPYNYFAPRHNNFWNMLFAAGSVSGRNITQFATNDNDMWGTNERP